MTDLRQSKSYAKYMESQGWVVEYINGVYYYLKKVPILGWILKIQRPDMDICEAWLAGPVKILSDKYKPYQICIEPNLATGSITKKYHNLLLQNGYKLSKSPFLPTKTLRIDLTRSVKEITNDFEKRLKSKIVRGSKVKTSIIASYKDLENFQKSWKNSVNSLRYVASVNQLNNIIKSFPQKDSLLLASHNMSSRVIGGALFTICREINDTVCYYWYGFTNKEGRALLSHFSLMYQAILWAKNRGCTSFDFDGIYDERFPKKSWLGFTRFKKEFGGYEVPYPGCYTKLKLPVLTWIMNFKSKLLLDRQTL